MLSLTDMAAAGVLLPLHRSTVTRLAECAIEQRRWSDLRSLLTFIEQRDPQVLSLELVGLLTKRLEAAERAHSGEDARWAAVESERLVRFCLACLEQQNILRAFSTNVTDVPDGDNQDSSFDLLSLSLIVEFASTMPQPAIRRLLFLLLLSSDQRRRSGRTPTRLFLRCHSEQLVPAITTYVRTLGGAAVALRPDGQSPSTAGSLLTEYNSLHRSSSSGAIHTSLHSVASDTLPAVLFVSSAARVDSPQRDECLAACSPVVSAALHDSSCSVGDLLRDVWLLREDANWPPSQAVSQAQQATSGCCGCAG